MAITRLRSDPVRLFGRRLALLALLLLVLFAAYGVWSAYQKERESKMLRDQAQAQLDDLSQRQTQLNANIATLETPRGQEGALRDEYALAAKGEGMIVIVNPTTTPIQEASSSAFAQWVHEVFPWW